MIVFVMLLALGAHKGRGRVVLGVVAWGLLGGWTHLMDVRCNVL